MKRQIIFRGKCTPESKYAGEWVYGGCVQCDNGETLIVSASSGNCTFTYHVVPESIGQYTGLSDVNGNDIYEGDIVKMTTAAFGDEIFRIGYENSHIGAFCLCSDEQEDTSRFVGIFGRNYGYEPFYCEVIGNVYDNPELLKQ